MARVGPAAGERFQAPLAARRPTADDLRIHTTTVFAPVRLRGWLELRYLDCCPPGLWLAATAAAVGLLDDPHAADRAAELTAPVASLWREAARDGPARPPGGRGGPAMS